MNADFVGEGLQLPNQIMDLHAERIGDDLQRLNGNVRLSALDLAHVRSIEPGEIPDLILRPPAL